MTAARIAIASVALMAHTAEAAKEESTACVFDAMSRSLAVTADTWVTNLNLKL